jgi:hypothetical protein
MPKLSMSASGGKADIPYPPANVHKADVASVIAILVSEQAGWVYSCSACVAGSLE